MIPRIKPEGMLSENRFTPRIKSGAGFFGIMLYFATTAVTSISSSMPWMARPLITRKVLAGIGPPA